MTQYSTPVRRKEAARRLMAHVVVVAGLALLQYSPALAQAPAENRAQLVSRLHQQVGDAHKALAATREDFKRTRAHLLARNLPASILARHDQAAAEFEQRAGEFERKSRAWQAADNDQTLQDLSRFLEQHRGPKRAAPGLGKLPWGSKGAPRLPAETKTSWYQKLTRDFKVDLAQAGGLTTIGGVRFSHLPETSQAPQDADLAETPETALTTAIRAKAQALGHNPVQITNWLRNNVQWVPTWGGLQTADTTLKSLRGNALDTANLHVALLRASGIPARYQFGTIDVASESVMNWLGGLQQPEAALKLLNEGGIAARGITANGRVSRIRMEHVWVSAYVNWTPSRGARQGGWDLSPPQHPNPNGALNAWVPLDASYKQYTYGAGMNLAEVSPFNTQALLDASRQGATCTAAAAGQVNVAALSANYAQFKAQAQSQLGTRGANVPVGRILGTTALVRQQPALLAGVLPYETVVAAPAVAAVAPSLNWRVQIGLVNGLDPVLDISRHWGELDGQPLTLGFAPETDADAQALAALLRPEAGGDAATGLPTRIPAYLVKLKAQLRVGGQLVGEGGSFTLGQTLTLRTAVHTSDSAAPAPIDAVITVGETHVWALQGQAQGAAAPQSASARLAALRSQLDGAGLPSGTQQGVETLGGLAAAYQAAIDAKSRLYQRVADVVEVRLPSIARASSRLETDAVLGLVTHVRAVGVGLHVDRYGSASGARGQNADAAVAGYGQQGLQRASATAHQLFDRAFGPAGANAQSALSGLALAAAQGQSILRADTSTLPQVLAALDPASTLREQIEQAVATGHQALLAPGATDLGGLPMDALVAQQPQSGQAAYLVTSRNAPVVQLTAQRPGLAGWLGLADAQANKVLVAPVVDALIGQLNTSQTLVGDIDATRWQGFAGQDDLIDGLFQSRVAASANTGDACDWLISTLSSQLSAGLPSSARVNRAPLITSQPVLTALLDKPYSYSVVASDPDADALSFSLVGAPTGMSIDAAGGISWPRAVAGQFNITVRASDGLAVTQQNYTLAVGSTAPALQVNAALSPSIADAGQTVTLSVNAASSAGSVTRSATLDGAPLELNAQGVAVFSAPAAGTHRILVTASDAHNTTTREIILTVRDAADGTVPVAAITSPQADASLRGIATISGTASDANFAYYQLLLRRVGESDLAWQEFSRGLTPVTNGALGQLDTTRHDNALYQIALRVVDVNGRQTTSSVTVEFIGNLKLGQFRLSFADVRAEAPGLPLMLTRTYDSTKKDVMGDFGWGWSASGQDITVRKNMTFGLGWEVTTQQFQLCLRPVGRRRISISLPDGGLYRFDTKNAQECAFGQVPEPDIQFNPVPGPTGGAGGRVSAGAQLRVIDAALVQAQGGRLIDEEGNTWNPQEFELTTEEGFKYQLREGVGILSVTDPFGNKVSYGANGYSHSADLAVTLTRDAQGRITRATDPAGRSLTYTYNAQGELQSVTDRDGKTTSFTYASVTGTNTGATSGNVDLKHLLASITDPRGQVVMSNQFDEYGRLTGTANALGQAAQQEFELENNRQTVTDRRGNKTVYTFDADGNITQTVNALGQTTSFTFDANGNETSVTNAAGETITRTFDAVTGKQLTEKNHLGHTTATAYPTTGKTWQRLNPLSSTDAKGNATAYTYVDVTQPGATPGGITEPLGRATQITQNHVTGNLMRLDIAGERTDYAYDGQGRKTQETNALGHKTSYAYDASGNETSRTVTKSVNGVTVTFTTTRKYDAENRLIEETDALGGKRAMTYNAAGKIATQTDSLGRKTSYSYDANARLIKTEYPDGTSESTSYDAEGNETSKTDRAGRITRMEYDALNRLAKTIHADGSSEQTEYDPAGRVVATIDRNGRRGTMEYDGAGRQVASTDATGRRTSQSFDANGNRTSQTVDGRTTSFEYDALNRLTKTTWPDGSTHTSIYRPDNRKQSETDQRGVTTSYGYDAAGRLTSVAQSLSATATATTAYGYDETGAKVRQVDALGRTTTWTLDGNGRITSRQIQDGTKETSQYDAEGNHLTKKTFGGETLTFQYDSENKLTAQVIPNGAGTNSAVAAAAISYSYTPSGQLESQQEQGATTLGGTQSYRYDANDRLIQVTNPLGQITYSFDANGNVVERSVTNFGTIKSEYDAAGRLTKVTAPDGKQTRYSYDAAGRVWMVERELNAKDGQAQWLLTYNRYDSADRIIAVVEVKRIGTTETLIAGQSLTRLTGGTITRIETYRSGTYDSATGQFTGTPATIQAFEYDRNARLTRETRTKDGATTDTAYEYNAAGNRTKKTVTTAAGAEITTYSYDQADRLTQESTSVAAGGSRVTTYTWDGNGNLASKTEPGRVTLYRFDPQNRLIDIRIGATQAQAQAASPSVSYAYDVQGHRVKKGAAQASTYLVDGTHAYAQVVLETRGGQNIAYVRGAQLIRQSQGSSAAHDLFPLHGHLGTSLGAIDANGNVVEEVDADAFGNLDQPTGLKQTHLYTGQYWDQDAQLLYLRARWYDPKIGFISPDPFEGRQSDPRSLNRYSYAHSDPVHGTDPSGEMNAGESGAIAGGIGALSTLSLPAVGTYLAAAKTTHLAIASVPFMAMHGPRISQFIQGSGRAGFDALQRSVFMVARGAAATQQQIQSAWNVGSGYTNTLNQMMGARATQFGMQIHKLVEGSMHLPANFTYSLANMAPTPYHVHTAISALHSSRMFASGPSITVREFLARELAAGRLTPEQVYRIEAQIWAAAMQGQQLTARFVQMLASAP